MKTEVIGGITTFMTMAYILAVNPNILSASGMDPNAVLIAAALAAAVLGTSTTTTFAESSAGAAAGARTGLASMVTGVLFLISIVFAPVFTAIPGFATAPALIFVGFLMAESITKIDFSDLSEAVPAVLCVMTMIFTYNIAEGMAAGIVSYVFVNLLGGGRKKITPLMYVLAVMFLLKYIFL